MTLFQSWGFLGSDYPGVGGGTPIFSYIFRFGALLGGGGVVTKSDFFLGGGGHFYTF